MEQKEKKIKCTNWGRDLVVVKRKLEQQKTEEE